MITKSETKRSELLDLLADHILANGLSASSLRALAKAAETSDRMLLYYFKDKDDLMEAALTRVAERMVGLLSNLTPNTPSPAAEVQRRIMPLLLDKTAWPYMRVWLEIASKSANGDVLYQKIGERIGRGLLEWGASQIEANSKKHRDRDAAKLLAFIEGLVLLKSIGMDDVCDRALE